MDPAWPSPEAVGTRNDRIVIVETPDDAREVLSSQTRIVDLAGRTLIPGFIGAHSRTLRAAKIRGTPVVDIRAAAVPTYRALVGKIRHRVAAARLGEFLLFFDLDAQLHPDMESPSRALLDEIAPDNPIGIQVSNCHVLLGLADVHPHRG